MYGPTSTPIAQYDASDDVEFLLTDQLGSVRVVTDAVGAVVGSASFGVFGALDAVSGAVSAFGFTGAWTDEMTGLVYLRARDYDPATGQFLQVDPAVDDTRQPYAYAYNNPLLWTDPTGLDVWGDIGAGMLAFGAGVLDDLTFGASSAILGAVIPGYDCFTQTNPWFAAGQMTSAIVSTALLVATGVGAVVAAAKLVAKVGLKAAMTAGAATIKAPVRSAVQSVKSLATAGRSADSTRVFWSGGSAARGAAERWAQENGAHTLEMTAAGKATEEAAKNLPWEDAVPLFENASREFAEGAQGVVHVFQNGAGVRLRSFWALVEYPVLRAKGNPIIYHIVDGR